MRVFARKIKQLVEFVMVALLIHPHANGQQPVTWNIDNRKTISGKPTSIIGNPQVIETSIGKAVLFNGSGDGLIVDHNPISGARTFTIEAIFRPDPGGSAEQRWLHIQEDSTDNRILLEIRLTGNQWFLDSFIKSGENRHTLYSEDFKHRAGEWYHAALIYDGATMRHYVDGVEELSAPITFSPLAAGQTSIGVRLNRVSWFKGAISKARFTPRALSPKEFMKK